MGLKNKGMDQKVRLPFIGRNGSPPSSLVARYRGVLDGSIKRLSQPRDSPPLYKIHIELELPPSRCTSLLTTLP